MSNQLATIPFHGQSVQTTKIDGKPVVGLKPITENLGLDYATQLRKLKNKTWASLEKALVQASDGKTYETTCVDLRTLTMWLATIDENRVSEEARPLVVAYQQEIADVIESYWAKGGAINPRATEHQINALIFQARSQIELCQAAKGLIQQDHLEAKARIILARGLGEAPELNTANQLLYTADFLKEKGLSDKKRKSVASVFGKRVKAAYTLEHGEDPGKYPLNLPNGQIRNVCAYTEADRPLMEQVWNQYYAA
ncbi:phage antirepressor N-terminal domain-containing protein [Corynebacterium ulcerans]|uniref:phage antirepressor N-terminal domain-containing protein n=1 Tax=Corynebacterium ulcerans TaxID=65058 RepID=UPI00051F744C|nr:phage antirepressor N-terminal domain-containing protein [Corynebacterium ulcerans]AIT89188.1 Antirepressor [Corynebacterium ulcerans]ALD94964.1 Antirepressor [Corynebacterium ulcerans]